MDSPPINGKALSFKDKLGSIIEVNMNIKDNNIIFRCELSENQISKRSFSAKYALDVIKEKNQFFFCAKTSPMYLNK